jgi:hypothetical protein
VGPAAAALAHLLARRGIPAPPLLGAPMALNAGERR